ncbi:MAG: glycosyltransferase family 9 protein [Nanoarchaeota archaeon]
MIQSIAIIKLGAAGDVLRTTCILQGLKEIHPTAKITWITKETAIPLLEHNPFIHELIAVENFSPKKFDFVISLDEDEQACKIAAELKADAILFKGFYWDDGVAYTPDAEQYYRMSALGPKPMNDVLKKQNTLTYQQHILKIIGIKPVKSETIFNLTDDEKGITQSFKKEHALEDKFTLGLNTGAGKRWPLKRLSIEKTVELAELLAPKAKIVLFGGPEEKERNQEIMEKATCTIIDAGTNNPVRIFAAKLAAVDLLITSDSLALHIAIALKRKIIAFFGPTSASEIELYGLGEKIFPDIDCYCCYKKESHSPNCSDAITIDMIIDTLHTIVPNL